MSLKTKPSAPIAPAGLSLLLLDLDGLKKINDNFGHLFGSRAISASPIVTPHSLPRCRYAARYGGDEFAWFSLNRQKTMRIVLRIVSAKFSPTIPSSRLSPRVSAYPHTAAMATHRKLLSGSGPGFVRRKAKRGKTRTAPDHPRKLPNSNCFSRSSLFVRASRCCVRRELFRDLRLVSHHNTWSFVPA